MNPKILFVLKHVKNPYDGYSWDPSETLNTSYSEGKPPMSSGLYNSARFVADMLSAHDIEVKLVTVKDNNAIAAEVQSFGADIVIIEAFWVVPSKFEELKTQCPDTKFVIRNHSETPFLASDGIAFDWMLQYADMSNTYLACNSRRMFDDTRFLVQTNSPTISPQQLDSKVSYLPNYYPLDSTEITRVQASEFVDVGCFGAIRLLKNHMTQAVASLMFAKSSGKRLRFHINSGGSDQSGEQILKNLQRLFAHYPQHQLVSHAWLPHPQFKALLQSMDIIVQVSFSETFNIIAADAVTSGVATITSDEVSWTHNCFKADPTDSSNIAKTMEKAYLIKKAIPSFNPSLKGLKAYNKEAVQDWLSFIASH